VKYLLLINKNEEKYRALLGEERRAMDQRYAEYAEKMFAAGIARAGGMLEPADAATTVRVREGRRLLTDGPFVETVEQIAGIAIIEVRDLDEALEWAASHPDAEWGSVEVRPLMGQSC
jgi:hypothetical protein